MIRPGSVPPDQTFVEGGVVWLLRLLDVADTVDLEHARRLTAGRGATRMEKRTRGPERAPSGVMFQAPPLAIDAGADRVAGLDVNASVRIFDFGVVSVRFAHAIPRGTSAADLARLAARFDTATDVDDAARRVWAPLSDALHGAIRGAHVSDVTEDYTLFEINGVRGCTSARQALARLEPWKLLLAEPERPVAETVIEAHMSRAIQYFEDDAALIDWNAALVLDPDGSRDELEVLEIATARLLEMRYYDRLLARELGSLYEMVEAAQGSSGLLRNPFADVAARAATLFVDMTQLYDRIEGNVTLVGDAYTARLYREAAQRFRLAEASEAVKEKIATLAQVSEVYQGQLSQRRGLLLETAVVVLIVLELVEGFLRR
jgi:hypothetical protein